jgi:hypothetical protein
MIMKGIEIGAVELTKLEHSELNSDGEFLFCGRAFRFSITEHPGEDGIWSLEMSCHDGVEFQIRFADIEEMLQEVPKHIIEHYKRDDPAFTREARKVLRKRKKEEEEYDNWV